MANARREVDLIVKAKDDAVRVLDAITDAINGMIDASTDLTKNAKGTATGIAGLVGAVSDLGRALKGGSNAEKLAADLAKANKAVDALRDGLQQSQAEFTEYSQKAGAAAASSEKLRGSIAKTEKELADQNAALTKATAQHGKYEAGLRGAESEIKKLTRSIPSLTQKIFDQQAKVEATSEKYDALGAKLAAAERPSATLQERFANLGKRLSEQTAKLTEYRAQLESSVAEMEQAGAAALEFSGNIERSAAGIKEQEAAIAATNQQLAGFKASLKEVSVNQRELENSTTKAGMAVKRQEGQLAGAEKNVETLGAAIDGVSANMAQFAATADGVFSNAFATQRRMLLETKREWAGNEAAIKEFTQAVKAGVAPTVEQSEAFIRNMNAARQNKAEYNLIQQSLHQLSQVLRTSATDIDSLTTKTERVSAIQRELAAALAKSRQEATEAAAAESRLNAELAKSAAAAEKKARATREDAAASQQAASRTNALATAYRQIYGETRQALSYTQRLRGEVLSLVSAYGGIFGVITMLQRVVEATQKVERAQVRLNALYGGDLARAGDEFDFISRQADRLGIDIGELADEYTKFSAATKGTVLAGKQTRDIFMRVAEAGRVNGLSMADMSGIFKALTQIASKGKVQLEELTGQLGDRLPGALQIMADGLGITTEELLELTKQGAVSSSALAKFADNLAERYSTALPAALKTTSAEIGRFENALTRALLVFGQGGFIEGFNALLRSLTATLKDADFLAFAQNVSSAFGLLAQALGLVAQNFKLVVAAASAFLAIRLLPAAASLALGFTRFATAINQANIAAAVARREQAALGVAASTAATRVSALSIAANGLRGGLAGLAVGGIVLLLTEWLTSADEVNTAMTEHQRIMGLVKTAYDSNQESVEAWRKSLSELSTQELTNNLARVKSAAETARINRLSGIEELANSDMVGDPRIQEIARQVVTLTNELFDGKKSVEEYRTELDKLSQKAGDLGVNGGVLQGLIESNIKTAETDAAVAKAVREAADALDVKVSNTDKAEDAMKRLNGATDTSGRSIESMAAGSKTFNSALDEMKSLIPEVNKGLDVMQQKANLDAAFQSAVRAAQTISELNGAIKQYNETASALFANAAGADLKGITDGVEAAATILRAREGFIPYAKMDVNAYRTGFGSDTTTDANNVVRQVTAATRVTVADANRDLYRRIGEFNNVIVGQIGERFGQFSAAQQGVLTSIAYNYGELPASLAKVINANGTPEEIAAAIRGLQNDNKGINRDRRLYEAAAFEQGTDVQAETKAYLDQQKEITKEKEKQVEAAAKFHEEQAQQNEALAQENALQNENIIKRETAKAITEAENRAKAAGTELTAQERAQIEQNIAAKYREQAAQDAVNASKKTAEEAEARFNAYVQQRAALLKQAEALRAQGNTAGAQQATNQANALKTSMDQAAAAAIAMWQKIGGPEAQAAIEKIKQANLESQNLKNTGNQVSQMWTAVGQSLMDNLSTAIDEFAQAVANGENAWKALGRALQKAAAQFLIDIGKMIIKQMLFNALSGIFPGLANPLGGAVAHSGTGSGTIGSNIPNRTRSLDARVFANAPRFHKGYQAGLGSNEVAAVLEKTESVQTKDSPFHPDNQAKTLAAAMAAGGGGGPSSIKVLNLIDSAQILEEALNTPAGTKVFVNKMRKEKASVKEVMK